MHASPFDFVSALSAEEFCPVCKELHAAVDECLCSSCQAHVCLDCSSLQPDTSWICAPCAARAPARAYPSVQTRPVWVFVQQLGQAMREHARHSASELRSASTRLHAGAALTLTLSGSLPRMRAALHAAFIAVLAVCATTSMTLRTWVAAAIPRLQSLTVRSRRAGLQVIGRMGATSRDRAGRLLLQVRRLQRNASSLLQSSLQTLRNLSVREQVSCVLIAVMLMIAIARANNASESH